MKSILQNFFFRNELDTKRPEEGRSPLQEMSAVFVVLKEVLMSEFSCLSSFCHKSELLKFCSKEDGCLETGRSVIMFSFN